MDPIIPPSASAAPEHPTEIHQLRVEVAELKQLILKVRRGQRMATWMGVVKVLVYVGLVGAAAVALRGVLGSGLGAITGIGMYGAPSSTSPTGLDFSALIKNVQELQNGQ